MAAGLTALSGCCTPKVEITSENPSAFLSDKAKIEQVHSLQTLDEGRLLVMDYTLDYKLDELLEANVGSFQGLMEFAAKNLMDVLPESMPGEGMDAGCSAFATIDPQTGDKLMGRNYDYCHVENGEEVPLTAILVRTSPEGGKKSISMIDSYWIGYTKGFYKDGKSDLSQLMTAPYSLLDGINEDGLAVGVLHLKGNPAMQDDPEKKFIWGNIAMRAMLDKAGTVEEAIELVRSFNIVMDTPAKGNNHFFIADATGDYAIIEFSFKDGVVTDDAYPTETVVLKGREHSYVTNFYVDPALADNEVLGGKSDHGKARYLKMQDTLRVNAYKLTEEQAMNLLKAVSTASNPAENTSHTQWSALYNLSKRTMDLSILQEYEKKYSFKVE